MGIDDGDGFTPSGTIINLNTFELTETKAKPGAPEVISHSHETTTSSTMSANSINYQCYRLSTSSTVPSNPTAATKTSGQHIENVEPNSDAINVNEKTFRRPPAQPAPLTVTGVPSALPLASVVAVVSQMPTSSSNSENAITSKIITKDAEATTLPKTGASRQNGALVVRTSTRTGTRDNSISFNPSIATTSRYSSTALKSALQF